MIKEKLYFRSIDDNRCYPLDEHIKEAKLECLSEITLIEAIPDTDTSDFVWCTYFGECTEKSMCELHDIFKMLTCLDASQIKEISQGMKTMFKD